MDEELDKEKEVRINRILSTALRFNEMALANPKMDYHDIAGVCAAMLADLLKSASRWK
jgi:hypothetical protein